MSPDAGAIPGMGHGRTSASGRRHGWRWIPSAAALCVAIAVAVLAANAKSLDGRSGFVQAHGIRADGTVRAVVTDPHCSFYDGECIPTTRVRVELTSTVMRHRTTTVYLSHGSQLTVGSRATVLLDPHQVTYAELPGSPYHGGGGWLLLAIVAVVALILAGALSPYGTRFVRRRKSTVLLPGNALQGPQDEWRPAADATAEEVGSAGPKVGFDGRPLPRPPFEGFGPGI